MPQVVKVTHTDQSQNGKARVYFDGRNGWKDAYYVKQGLYLPTIGETIEIETHAWTPPGKNNAIWYLDSYKQVKAPGAEMPPRRTDAPSNGQYAPQEALTQPQKGWPIQSGDLSRFVSNVIGSAIAAGLIKEPQDMERWAMKAYDVGDSLVSGDYEKRQKGPDPSTHAGDPGREDGDPGFDDKNFPF